jgi:hypothetical protein
MKERGCDRGEEGRRQTEQLNSSPVLRIGELLVITHQVGLLP